MLRYYTATLCSACHIREKLYQQVHDYCRKNGRLDLQVVRLSSTEQFNDYFKNIKPYRNGRKGLPMVFDDETKQEILFDGKEGVRRRKVLRRGEQETQEPDVSGHRRTDSAEAESGGTEELAPEG